ncbi:MAG TPA: hypothetical protein VFV52_11080 [Bacilli bacterium]|nr:hypothetical protein [Bacilli bacterium]
MATEKNNNEEQVQPKRITISEEEIEQAVEQSTREAEEEGAFVNIACPT